MNVIVDTGFWYSFLGTREQVRHSVAEVVFGKLNNLDANFLVPFPTLYEAINTKLLKDKYRDKADWFLKQFKPEYNDIVRDFVFRVVGEKIQELKGI